MGVSKISNEGLRMLRTIRKQASRTTIDTPSSVAWLRRHASADDVARAIASLAAATDWLCMPLRASERAESMPPKKAARGIAKTCNRQTEFINIMIVGEFRASLSLCWNIEGESWQPEYLSLPTEFF